MILKLYIVRELPNSLIIESKPCLKFHGPNNIKINFTDILFFIRIIFEATTNIKDKEVEPVCRCR